MILEISKFLFSLPQRIFAFVTQYWILLIWAGGLIYLSRFRTRRLYREMLTAAEGTLTAGLFAVAIVLQIAFWTHAGGLWRDEVNSINLAAVPHIRDLWNHLDGDSFPMLWFLVLRTWAWMGLAGNDLSIRALGLLFSLSILAAIWWNARRSGVNYPVVSLLLVACNPVFIRCIGANRAYGLGIALLLATYGAIGALARQPFKWARFVGACILAILCVQCLYYNTVFVWMITGSAAIVALCRKDRSAAAACAGVGLIATLTMLPYVITVHKQREWSAYIASPSQFGDIVHGLVRALDSQGPFTTAACVCLCGFALVFSCRYLLRRGKDRSGQADREHVLFPALCLGLCGTGICVFLWLLKYPVHPWYFAGFFAVAGVSLDALVTAALAADEARRTARLAFAAAVALASLVTTQQAVLARQTNIDLVAATLQKTTTRNDLIVVAPWYFGTTFDRYYRGSAAWQTLPPLAHYRFDFVRSMVDAVKRDQSIAPDLERVKAALQSGGRVLIVGDLPSLQALDKWPVSTQEHRHLDLCLISWYSQIRIELRDHSRRVAAFNPAGGLEVKPIESAGVETWEGWRDVPAKPAAHPAAKLSPADTGSKVSTVTQRFPIEKMVGSVRRTGRK